MHLELIDVHAGFGERAVLRGLELALDEGRIGCLLGPSGCGKTTGLRCVAGFEPIRRGQIIAERAVLSGPGFTVPPELRGFGMVFQDYALLPHLDVLGNVAFGLHALPGPQRRSRARQILATVGLEQFAAMHPHELSGGQQQRVALARALAPQPRLLLLDEPFSSLDAELRRSLAGEVRQILKGLGTTVLMVTHDQQEAFAVADEIGVLRDGRIVQWGSAYDIYHRPVDRFVAEFIGEGVFVPGQVRAGGGIEIELGVLDGGDRRYPAGRRLEVLLRADDIVHDDASPLTAEVAAKAFRGAEILYTLRLTSGRRVLALVPSHHDHRIGESIGIRLAAEHVVVFDAEAGAGPRPA